MTSEPHVVDVARDRSRLLAGLEQRAGLSPGALGGPGTTVCPTADRLGSKAASCYRVDEHLVVWCDPALAPVLASLAGPARLSPDDIASSMAAAGLSPDGAAAMRLLVAPLAEPLPTQEHLTVRHLHADEPAHVAMVRRFVGRFPHDEAQAAGLDDLSEFDEAGIAVVVDERIDAATSAASIVAYSSAMPWEWDPAFADIAVLVDGGYRGSGLGRTVAAATTAELLDLGRIPLYRHTLDNHRSAALAQSLGFEPVATLHRYSRA